MKTGLIALEKNLIFYLIVLPNELTVHIPSLSWRVRPMNWPVVTPTHKHTHTNTPEFLSMTDGADCRRPFFCSTWVREFPTLNQTLLTTGPKDSSIKVSKFVTSILSKTSFLVIRWGNTSITVRRLLVRPDSGFFKYDVSYTQCYILGNTPSQQFAWNNTPQYVTITT